MVDCMCQMNATQGVAFIWLANSGEKSINAFHEKWRATSLYYTLYDELGCRLNENLKGVEK